MAIDSQVFFVRGLNRAKMEVLGSGPEGRTCSEFDCSTGRKNLACPCFDRANEMNEENSRSFPLRDLAVPIGSQFLLTTVDSFGGGLLCFFEIWKNRSAPPKHTGVFDVFSRF